MTLQSGLSEESQRFKDWVAQSWVDVQMRRADWLWKRNGFSFNTTSGQSTYTPAQAGVTDLGDWDEASIRQYLVQAGVGSEIYLTYVDWTSFRNAYLFGAIQAVVGAPLNITVTPAQSLQMWPTPSAAYTIRGEYFRAPSELVNDADDPASAGLPERFHMLLVYKAMAAYAAYEAAPEVMERALREEHRMMGQLERFGLPAVEFGGSL